MMNRNTRSTLLTLFASGLLVLGVTGCLDEESSASEEQSTEGEETSTEGFTGVLSGEVEYLAPGEYIVNNQAFFVSESTTILSGLYACPAEGNSHVENGAGTLPCDFDTFNAALEEGTVVLAEVVVSGGIAESIIEYAA